MNEQQYKEMIEKYQKTDDFFVEVLNDSEFFNSPDLPFIMFMFRALYHTAIEDKFVTGINNNYTKYMSSRGFKAISYDNIPDLKYRKHMERSTEAYLQECYEYDEARGTSTFMANIEFYRKAFCKYLIPSEELLTHYYFLRMCEDLLGEHFKKLIIGLIVENKIQGITLPEFDYSYYPKRKREYSYVNAIFLADTPLGPVTARDVLSGKHKYTDDYYKSSTQEGLFTDVDESDDENDGENDGENDDGNDNRQIIINLK